MTALGWVCVGFAIVSFLGVVVMTALATEEWEKVRRWWPDRMIVAVALTAAFTWKACREAGVM